MSTQECPTCREIGPVARYCVNCGESVNRDILPRGSEYLDGFSERVREMTTSADHYTVTQAALRSHPSEHDRPLGGYLHLDEQPKALLQLDKVVVDSFGKNLWTVKTGFRRSGYFLPTEKRLLAIVPDAQKSQVIAVPLSEIATVSIESGWRNAMLSVELNDASTYLYHLGELAEKELEFIRDLIRESFEGSNSTESTIRELRRKMDATIATSDSAEDALRSVADLFAETDEVTVYDQHVSDADSAEELFQAFAAAPNVTARTEEREEQLLPAMHTSTPTTLRERIASTAQNVDPDDVGRYTIGASILLGKAVVGASISTPIGLTALVAGGAVTGAYASTHPDSTVAQIDPIAFAINARTFGRVWRGSPMPGGHGTGAIFGAIKQLENEDIPPEYAEWVANVDFEHITRGAELAVRWAERSTEFDNPTQAAVFGGSIGLAYGFLDIETQDSLEELLDEDLYAALDLSGDWDGIDRID